MPGLISFLKGTCLVPVLTLFEGAYETKELGFKG